MNFLAASLASPATRAKELARNLSTATLENDVLDVIGEIAKFAGASIENKKYLAEHLDSIFQAIKINDANDEARPGLLDILLELVTIRDPGAPAKPTSPTSVMHGNVSLPSVDKPNVLHGTGLGGRGAATFDWLQIPLSIADAVLRNGEHMALLLQLLTEKRHWTRRSTLNLLSSLLESRPSETEEAIVHSATGMQSILDLLDDLDERYSVQALLLLEKLTEQSTHFRKYIFAFRDGFGKLFQIINAEDTADSVVRDCLSVLNNAMGASRVLQDRFFECGCANDLALLFSRLILPRGDLEASFSETPDSRIFQPLKAASLQALRNALQLVWCLCSGFTPESIVLECNGPAFTLDEALRSDIPTTAPIPHARDHLGSANGLIEGICAAALVLRPRDQAEIAAMGAPHAASEQHDDSDQLTTAVRCAALKVLGDLCAGHSKNVQKVLGVQLVGTPSCLAVESDFRYFVEPGWEGLENAYVHLGALDGVMRVTLFAYGDDDLAAGSYCLSAMLHENANLAITLLGHALQRPPDLSNVVNKSTMQVLSTPPAGRILVETVVKTVTLIRSVNARPGTLDLHTRVDFLRFAMWRSGRIFERLLAADVTCRMLASQLLVSADPLNDGSKEDALSCLVRQLSFALVLPKYKSLNLPPAPEDLDVVSDDSEVDADLKPALESLYHAVVVSLLRIICVWISQCDRVADEISTSPTSLFLFSMAKDTSSKIDSKGQSWGMPETEVQALSSLIAGNCLTSCSTPNRGKVFQVLTRMVGLQVMECSLNTLERSSAFQLTKRSIKALEREGLMREVYDADFNLYDKAFVGFWGKCRERIRNVVFEMYTEGAGSTKSTEPQKLENGIQVNTDSERFLVSQMDHLKEFIRIQDEQLKSKDMYIEELQQQCGVPETSSKDNAKTDNMPNQDLENARVYCEQLENQVKELESKLNMYQNDQEPQHSPAHQVQDAQRQQHSPTNDDELSKHLSTEEVEALVSGNMKSQYKKLWMMLAVQQVGNAYLLETIRRLGGDAAASSAVDELNRIQDELLSQRSEDA